MINQHGLQNNTPEVTCHLSITLMDFVRMIRLTYYTTTTNTKNDLKKANKLSIVLVRVQCQMYFESSSIGHAL